MYSDNEILFPHSAIPALKRIRGEKWEALVERVMHLPEFHEETLAFMHLMIQLNTCINCETDSYRAMRGCSSCAQQTLRRFKGTDDDLLRLYEDSLDKVRAFRAQGQQVGRHIVDDSDAEAIPAIIPANAIRQRS